MYNRENLQAMDTTYGIGSVGTDRFHMQMKQIPSQATTAIAVASVTAAGIPEEWNVKERPYQALS